MYHRIGKNGNKYWGKQGAGFVFTDGESILLLKRSEKGDNHGKWGIPGGKAEEEETALGCAQRETQEEIGRLPKGRRIGSIESVDGRHVFTTYVCLVPAKFSCKLSDEHSDYDWYALDDLKNVELHDKLKEVMPDIRKIIEKKSSYKEMSGFAAYLEVGGATSDLFAGYRKNHPDYQVEGDPSSMNPQVKKKSKNSYYSRDELKKLGRKK